MEELWWGWDGIRGDSASYEIPLMKIIITKILRKCCVMRTWFGFHRLMLVKLLSTVALNKVVLDVRNCFTSS